MGEQLEDIRRKIDVLDEQIVRTLVKRTNLALEAVKHKSNEEEVRGLDRVQIVLDKVGTLAEENGGNSELVIEVYKKIIELLTEAQLEVLNR